ncbi:MAG: UDP-N-acetylmuramoyl-L-alanine--D-glutamate ligase, partial [Neisseriaceae bacterium]|nr:UDP-N-acetylmuramoyl-L-alanine--D-glutamate ligase [Neisseriaceae bacterium]
QANGCLMHGSDILGNLKDLPLTGMHNATNILAALALCESIGLSRSDLLSALPQFKGLPHRVEKIGEHQGVIFIDDSKGTNVGATAAALAGADVPVVLIAGGLGKGQDFSPLADAAQGKVKHTFLIGQDADKIQQAFQAACLPTTVCESLEEATQKAFQAASSGDWVLLSPACASMDMFRDYAHRSEVFIQSFQELAS